jgi:KipI family sensor histidine kinase inhibitor
MKTYPHLSPFGDRGILIEFSKEINPRILYWVREITRRVAQSKIAGIGELIPSYCSLFVGYDPFVLSCSQILFRLRELLPPQNLDPPAPTPIKRVPVVYGGDYGPDLSNVARYHRCSPEEIVRWHTSTTYLVYVIGGFPGLPAMGTVPREIETPRLSSPREKVEPGSVAIAGKQTGIYAIESPGGWHLIGRTPLQIFDPKHNPPALFQAGDRVQFFPITESEFANNPHDA